MYDIQTMLQYTVKFSKFALFLPFCMIEHGFVPIIENDEKSKFIIIVNIKKCQYYYINLKIFQNFSFFTLLHDWAWFCVILENDEKSLFFISFYIKKWRFYYINLKFFKNFPFSYPSAWLSMILCESKKMKKKVNFS